MNAQAIRDLVLVPDETRAALEDICRGVLQAWALDWLPDGSGWQADTCLSEAIGLGAEPGWLARGRGDGPQAVAWAQEAPDSRGRLARLLVGRDTGSPLSDDDWACQAAGRALADLQERMQGPCSILEPAQPEFSALSGIVAIHERSLGLRWAWAPAAHPRRQLRNTAKPPAAVQPLLSGLALQRVRVHAGLGEVDILVSDLLALQAGDVIRFPTRLEDGVPVSIGSPSPSGAAVQARLGQREGRVALCLLAGAPSAP